MIGYYIHHHGSGHLHRAQSVATAWGDDITGLSTLPRPLGWTGAWVQLEPDAPLAEPAAADVTANRRLHWAPLGHEGMRHRMTSVSSWISAAQPLLLVCDVSVEVALLARLHGVKVVSVVLPGQRNDTAHLLGYGVSQSLVALWPESALVRTGLTPELNDKVRYLGGLSRFPTTSDPAKPHPAGKHQVAVLWGSGGDELPHEVMRAARNQSPDWEWTVLGGESWDTDPFPTICSADVVLTHAGQNAIAEVAAARRPAIVVPQARPFHEQHMTAHALHDEQWPALVLDEFPHLGWNQLLEQAERLDGEQWSAWCDGRAVERFVQVLDQVSAS